ncbi:Electron transfer flavoprotein subunit alpha, mitochondrial domain protein [Aspergillus niger]|uniref:Electron transfer flavoprotein subunit alpha, mitochondrial domain protein n=1 Tax=Aspergillus niger TaxID=5061 RepID=A0A505IFK7_ASPNG|nr:Electron transfer flavoprotein subunit alpha, mitochondrial domain protein [Aspergillus niger]
MPESVKSTSTFDDASSSYSVSSTASTLKDLKATSKKWLPSKEKKEETKSASPKPASPKPAKEKSRAPSTNYTTLATDEDIRPDTPTRTSKRKNIYSPIRTLTLLPSSPPSAIRMPLIASPAPFPSSAPSPESQKRKNEEQSQTEEPKRQKIMGGFLDEADDDDDWDAFNDAQLRSEFQVQEDIIQQPPVELPEIPRPSQLPTESTPKPASTAPDLEPTPVPEQSTVTSLPSRRPYRSIQIKTCSGKTHHVSLKKPAPRVSYERLVAGRSVTAPGRAQKSYYGIDIHRLLDEAANEPEAPPAAESRPAPTVQPSIEAPIHDQKSAKLAAAMWTEKYRARKFTELIGDERTHRSVLRWLKAWEPIVFPNIARSKAKKPYGKEDEERTHRKVLLLCGPPGLGKTTLAHVCARQAGYEVLEINASDDRSKDVVKGRIRDSLGTENVKGMNVEIGEERVRKAGRPVCVVVDEVDGVVSGSGGGGEGGFMKALIDLVLLDQKNSSGATEQTKGRKKKGDNFRFLRPLIMVCNDVYHPSLRPLRAASVAEIIHVRQAPLENVVTRMKRIFTVEGIPSDNDGVRRLCEASWGLARRKQGGVKSSGTAEGDIRSVLVAAEWVAHKLRNECPSTLRLTRSWLEQKVLSANSSGSAFFKGLNRGGVRDLIERVFTEGAGFTDAPVGVDSFRDPFSNSEDKVPVGVADLRKRHAIERLREMVDASGEHDRAVAECFASYPLQSYQDDTFLSKPNAAYDWLHFHDTMSSKVYTAQDWELSAYLSQSVVAFHHLFATAQGKAKAPEVNDEEEEHPFSGPRADFAAYEAQKQNRAILTEFQSAFSAPLSRLFRSTDSLVIDLIPNLVRMLSPDVKPVVSERTLIQAAVRVMAGLGVRFEKVRIENAGAHGGWAYRMEPPLDTFITFSKTKSAPTASGSAPVRYAIRQVLDQEYRKENIRKQSEPLTTSKIGKKSSGKSADGQSKDDGDARKPAHGPNVKRDFFGRVIKEPTPPPSDESPETAKQNETLKAGRRVWVTYHDGFSNAVRKPISMGELLAEL